MLVDGGCHEARAPVIPDVSIGGAVVGRIITSLTGAVAFALVGIVCWVSARVERNVARAEEALATGEYAAALDALEPVGRYYEQTSRFAGIGKRALTQVRAYQAAAQYWQHRYAAIVPLGENPVALLPADNVELQLIVANAVYRAAQAEVRDRQSQLQALEAGIRAYQGVLKNSRTNDIAAFNYEYLTRQRGAILSGSAKLKDGEADGQGNPHGQPGGAPQRTDMNDFKMQTPLDPKEGVDPKNGQDAGKTAPRERRG
jgi:hypothetical protein